MKNNLLRFSIALIFIIIICWCGYKFIYEGSNHGENNLAWMDKRRLLKHCLNYLWLLLIFIIGYWGLKHQHPIWLIKVWIIFYLTALLVLPAFGIIDWRIRKKYKICFRGIQISFSEPDTVFTFMASFKNNSNKEIGR